MRKKIAFAGIFLFFILFQASASRVVVAGCQVDSTQSYCDTNYSGGCQNGPDWSIHWDACNAGQWAGRTDCYACTGGAGIDPATEAKQCSGCGGGGGPPPTACGYCACTYTFHSQDCPRYACGNEIYSANCNTRSGEGCLWIDNTGVCTTACTGTYPNGTCIDGCNKTISCTPPCSPTTCAAQGKNCGTIDNGCGGTLSCGSCTLPYTCGGGGTPNVCGGCNITVSPSPLTVGLGLNHEFRTCQPIKVN